ncbi:MAG: aminomethyl transferase family protein [Planctomycetes bacterium]|nr:aminomethyl transferase family protein [Planctomycetota bacterium]
MNSPFELLVRARGAQLRPVEGGEYPIRFGRPFDEHKAARAAAALFDISFLGKFEVAGPDAAEFAQRMLSADMRAVGAGCGAASYLLSAQGKIQHSFVALATPDGYLFILEGSDVPTLKADLEKFRFAEKITYQDYTDVLGALLLAGPKSVEILAAASGGANPPGPEEYKHAFIHIAGSAVLVVRDRRSGSDGFLLLISRAAAEPVWNAIEAAGAARGMQPAGLTAYDSLRLEAGRPRFGLDYNNENFPQEVGDTGAFSLNKGCYPGQETVARIDTYGRVHRRLTCLILDSPNEDLPERGDKLLLGSEEIGRVQSWAISPTLERPIAFAIVRNAKASPGTQLEIQEGARRLTAKVVDPPIVAL